MNGKTRTPTLVVTLLGLVALSLLEYRAVGLIQGANLQAEVDIVTGILTGHPYWKAYQNRILGPVIVAGLSHLTGLPLAVTYRAFCFAAICLANVVCYFLFWDHGRRSRQAWAYPIAYAWLFVAFQDPEWLYLWDYVDLTTMLLFAWAIVMGRGASTWQLATLFTVELLNRESAMFIALWMVVDSVRFVAGTKLTSKVGVDSPRFAVGSCLGIAGVLWTAFIRNRWYVQETGIIPRPEIHQFAGGQFFMLPVTLSLWREFPTVASVTLLAFFGALVFLLHRAWGVLRQRHRAWKVGLIIGILTLANLCLAFVFELRVWFSMLPWLLCLAYLGQIAPGTPGRPEFCSSVDLGSGGGK